MKRIISTLLIAFAIIMLSTTAQAQELKSFDIISVSNSQYNIAIKVMNSTTSDLNDISYIGQQLSNYIFKIPTASKNNEFVILEAKWADPNYIIKPGEQTVEALLTNNITKEIITCNVYIYGITPPPKKLYGGLEDSFSLTVLYGCDVKDAVPPIVFFADGKVAKGTLTFLNWNSSELGTYELQWSFTPDDNNYETKTGSFPVTIIKNDSSTEEVTTPSLTASTVQLNSLTSYDINLDNKISGSTYQWTSSDTDVVEVNSKSGLLKARKEGKATVTCKVTTPDNETYNLTSNVIVGYDDNAPVLTETNLDLSVNDTYDINLENKAAKSKYRWTSSDRSIVKVNSATGKVKAVADGNAFVTCTITTPDNQVIVLRCDINVAE